MIARNRYRSDKIAGLDVGLDLEPRVGGAQEIALPGCETYDEVTWTYIACMLPLSTPIFSLRHLRSSVFDKSIESEAELEPHEIPSVREGNTKSNDRKRYNSIQFIQLTTHCLPDRERWSCG